MTTPAQQHLADELRQVRRKLERPGLGRLARARLQAWERRLVEEMERVEGDRE